jgi:hypothetical protein
VDQRDQNIGHRRAIQLVRRFMERGNGRRATRSLTQPVVVIEGARGYGKTALADGLSRRLDQRVPHARISFEQHREATVPEVLSAIAFQLGRTYDRYGSLRFPRLTIGRMVMRADLPDDLPGARAAIQRLLAAQVDLDTMRSILWDAAGAIAPALQLDDRIGALVRVVARLGLEGVLHMVRRAKSLSPDWYGHRPVG